jgi:hypothetical protein
MALCAFVASGARRRRRARGRREEMAVSLARELGRGLHRSLGSA